MKFWRRNQPEERVLSRESVPNVWLSGATIAEAPVNADAALRLVDVLACVRLLGESASILPLHAFRKTAQGRQRVRGASTDLLKRPAPATGQANFIAQMVGSLALRGEVFVGKFKQGESVVQLACLPIDRMALELKNGQPRYTITHDSGRETVHGIDDVLHVKVLSVDGIRGLSPIGYARESLGLATALQDTASALFTNQSTPRGVLTVAPGPTQGDVMENLKTAWEARHKGASSAGRVAVLAGESVKFEPVSIAPADAEFVDQRKLSTSEICRLFRVPAYLVNAEGGGTFTYSNAEQEGVNLLRFSLDPMLVAVEQAVTNDPDLTPPGQFWEFERDAILRTTAKERAEVYAIAIDHGWLDAEEVRARENLPPRTVTPAPLPNGNQPTLKTAGVK